MKRKYTQIQIVDTEIERMREEGKTRQEIADSLGLSKIQIKNWVIGIIGSRIYSKQAFCLSIVDDHPKDTNLQNRKRTTKSND